MQNRFFLILVFIPILLFSCDSKKKTTVQNSKLSFWEETIKRIDDELPLKINPDKYIKIYRFGSVEFSNDVTILCIPKKEFLSPEIPCYYYSITLFIQDDFKMERGNPEIFGHFILLENSSSNKKIELNKLKKVKLSELNNCISNKPKTHQGEWHCGNTYVLKIDTSDDYHILDYNSSIEEKYFIQSLYKQISASEYYQSFSLDEKCKKQPQLYNRLINNDFNSDTLKFKISYNIINGYW